MKRSVMIMVVVCVSLALLGTASAEGFAHEHMDRPDVELTEKEQKEISKLYKAVMKKKKKLISKYAEYGVITEEKAEKIMSHMDQKLEELKNNGYIPECRHMKHYHDEDRQ